MGPIVALLLCTGCGMQSGILLFHSGLLKSPNVQAEFKLTDGPVLVLVDDFEEMLESPEARNLLGQLLSQELVDKGAVKKIVRPEVVDDLRRKEREFDKRGCREVGRLAKADQVVWMRVRDYYAGEEAADRGEAAKITVAVKVINALEEKDKSKVRLWPASYDGSQVSVELTVGEVGRAGTREAIAKALCTKLAGRVAKLFYDHPMEDFSSQ
ncbi:MAG TPA: hypothetical protein VGM03_06745 [Phycisphaerae bacterium]|jgi:hypothetical protein